jgi:hypothetical protein
MNLDIDGRDEYAAGGTIRLNEAPIDEGTSASSAKIGVTDHGLGRDADTRERRCESFIAARVPRAAAFVVYGVSDMSRAGGFIRVYSEHEQRTIMPIICWALR